MPLISEMTPDEQEAQRAVWRANNRRYREKNLERLRRIQRDHNNKRYALDLDHRARCIATSRRKRFAKYGITVDDYVLMADSQNGLCFICSEPETVLASNGLPRGLAVDHCHSTSKVRSLLCTRCNILLGKVKDNPGLLRAAASYLEKHAEGGDEKNMEPIVA